MITNFFFWNFKDSGIQNSEFRIQNSDLLAKYFIINLKIQISKSEFGGAVERNCGAFE